MKNILYVLLFLTIAVLLFGPNIMAQKKTEISKYSGLNESKLFMLVNELRIKNNLPALIKNETLCQLASIRAEEIQSDWSHNQFKTERGRLINATGKYGENLSRVPFNEESVVNAWVDSPTHKDNLLNPNFTQTCIVCKNDKCAQEFSTTF